MSKKFFQITILGLALSDGAASYAAAAVTAPAPTTTASAPPPGGYVAPGGGAPIPLDEGVKRHLQDAFSSVMVHPCEEVCHRAGLTPAYGTNVTDFRVVFRCACVARGVPAEVPQ